MEQRTEEWHEARRTRISASEAGALLGLSPYRNARSARADWFKKYRGEVRDLSRIPDVQRGVELEGEILDRTEELLDIVIQQDGGRPYMDWLWASADGWTEAAGLTLMVEVKAPREFFEPDLRLDYLLQLYLQCIVYGAAGGYLVQGVVEEMGRIAIREKHYSIGELERLFPSAMADLHALWLEMVDNPEPEPEAAGAPDEFEALQTRYLVAKEAHAASQAALDEVKALLLEACHNQPVKGSRLQVIEQTRQGSVDWRELQRSTGVDVDKFRGNPSTYLTIREVKL